MPPFESLTDALPTASFIASLTSASVAYCNPAEGGPALVTVIDAETDTLRNVVALPEGGTLVGWWDEEHLLVRAGQHLQVLDLQGAVVHTVPVPGPVRAAAIDLRNVPARGEGARTDVSY